MQRIKHAAKLTVHVAGAADSDSESDSENDSKSDSDRASERDSETRRNAIKRLTRILLK